MGSTHAPKKGQKGASKTGTHKAPTGSDIHDWGERKASTNKEAFAVSFAQERLLARLLAVWAKGALAMDRKGLAAPKEHDDSAEKGEGAGGSRNRQPLASMDNHQYGSVQFRQVWKEEETARHMKVITASPASTHDEVWNPLHDEELKPLTGKRFRAGLGAALGLDPPGKDAWSMEEAFAAQLRQAWEEEEPAWKSMGDPFVMMAGMCQDDLLTDMFNIEATTADLSHVGLYKQVPWGGSSAIKGQLSPGTCSTAASEHQLSPGWMPLFNPSHGLDFSLPPACGMGMVGCT